MVNLPYVIYNENTIARAEIVSHILRGQDIDRPIPFKDQSEVLVHRAFIGVAQQPASCLAYNINLFFVCSNPCTGASLLCTEANGSGLTA